jgi:hypothetical protein
MAHRCMNKCLRKRLALLNRYCLCYVRLGSCAGLSRCFDASVDTRLLPRAHDVEKWGIAGERRNDRLELTPLLKNRTADCDDIESVE